MTLGHTLGMNPAGSSSWAPHPHWAQLLLDDSRARPILRRVLILDAWPDRASPTLGRRGRKAALD